MSEHQRFPRMHDVEINLYNSDLDLGLRDLKVVSDTQSDGNTYVSV